MEISEVPRRHNKSLPIEELHLPQKYKRKAKPYMKAMLATLSSFRKVHWKTFPQRHPYVSFFPFHKHFMVTCVAQPGICNTNTNTFWAPIAYPYYLPHPHWIPAGRLEQLCSQSESIPCAHSNSSRTLHRFGTQYDSKGCRTPRAAFPEPHDWPSHKSTLFFLCHADYC